MFRPRAVHAFRVERQAHLTVAVNGNDASLPSDGPEFMHDHVFGGCFEIGAAVFHPRSDARRNGSANEELTVAGCTDGAG